MARARPASTTQAGASYRVRGLVQGVGFRPAVWRLATSLGLRGEVLNDGEGVLIRAWGPPDALDDFSRSLRRDVPRLARIDDIVRQPLPGGPERNDFRIVGSNTGPVRTGVVADAATCPDCLAEVFDPAGRRYRYPFTNCTHCGPRLSIIRAIPYDRATTSMAAFAMCPTCLAEYENPDDRRFHAQPNACPDCGPRVWLADAKGNELPSAGDAIRTTAAAIREGRIVAVKGIGGFHLACDATNEDAVARLRTRKRRYAKPFALMARDIDMVSQYVRIADYDRAVLASAAAPIVILDAHDGVGRLAPSIAPGQSSLGFMLAYTPLHHLLMSGLCAPIVLTSGNRSDEPQVIANDEALASLAGIADLWLLNDRDIVSRLDDSVVRSMSSAPRLLRRARGYAPEPIQLGDGVADAPPVMAMGAELKSTICLVREGRATVSQHIGDLEDAATHADYRRVLTHYRELHCFSPALVAVDAHPDYLSTQWGEACARQDDSLLVRILTIMPTSRVASPSTASRSCATGAGDRPRWPWARRGRDAVGRRDRLPIMSRPSAWRASCRCRCSAGARHARAPRNAFAHLSQFIGWTRFAVNIPISPSRGSSRQTRCNFAGHDGQRSERTAGSSAGRLFDAVALLESRRNLLL
jgi:hydrogenase maturation protein HypF